MRYVDPDDSIKRQGLVNGQLKKYDLATLRPSTVCRKIFNFIGSGSLPTMKDNKEYHFFNYK